MGAKLKGMPTRVPKDVLDKAGEAEVALREFITDAREAFDEKSGHWQESEVGQEYDAWLAGLDDAADRFDDVEAEFAG